MVALGTGFGHPTLEILNFACGSIDLVTYSFFWGGAVAERQFGGTMVRRKSSFGADLQTEEALKMIQRIRAAQEEHGMGEEAIAMALQQE
jgi:hypothetical protein